MTETPSQGSERRPVISLFSGAMGLDLGLEGAGLDHRARAGVQLLPGGDHRT